MSELFFGGAIPAARITCRDPFFGAPYEAYTGIFFLAPHKALYRDLFLALCKAYTGIRFFLLPHKACAGIFFWPH